MSHLRRILSAALLLSAATSCNDTLQPNAVKLKRGANLISDGARGGNARFFLLPPLVSQPQFSGESDPDQAPTVVVCEWSESHCAAIVASFNRTDGSPSEGIVYDAASAQYHVNWNTDECADAPCALDPAKTYRLRVLVGSYELGFADLDVVPGGKELKNVETNQYIGLVDGRTLPIKFRIEKGAVAVVAAGTPVPVGVGGGIVATEDGIATLDIPAGALSATTEIKVSVATDPAILKEPWSEPVDLGPDGTTFEKPVKLTLSFDASQLPAGIPAAAVGVFTWAGDSWVEVPGSVVNEVDNTVSAPIHHFSTYDVRVMPNFGPGTFSNFSLYMGEPRSFSAVVKAYDVRADTYCYPVRKRVRIGFWYRYIWTTECRTVTTPYSYTPVGIRVYYFASPNPTPIGWSLNWNPGTTTLPWGYQFTALYPADPQRPVLPPPTLTAAFDAPGYGITDANGTANSPLLRGLQPGRVGVWAYTGNQLNSVREYAVYSRPVASIEASPTAITIPLTGPGSVGQLLNTMRDAAGVVITGEPYYWFNLIPNVVNLDYLTGRFTARAVGTGDVYVEADGKRAFVRFTVVEATVSSVTITPGSAQLSPTSPGNTAQLTAELKDASGNVLTERVLTWTSSDESVATVDASGVVTSVAPGSATITATSEGQSGTATVVVADPAPPTFTTASGPVDAGYEHTCAIRADGSVACWGSFPYGQGSIAGTAERPARLSAGFSTTCALRADGTVACYGSDGSGQVNVVPGTYTDVSTGWYSVCGLLADRTVACWGSNDRTQLALPGTYKSITTGRNHNCGVRTDGSILCTGGFAAPLAADGFLQVTMGESHACAIRDDGSIACWGSNQFQQLENVPTSGVFTQISAGSAATCALRNDGEILCWGHDNPFSGVARQSNIPAGPFVHLTVGAYHGCAKRANGKIVCWGRNLEGQTNVPAEFAEPPAPREFAHTTAVVTNPCCMNDIAVTRTDGTGFVNLTNTPNNNELNPSWSFDGREIAFERDKDIWVLNRETGAQRRLTFNGASSGGAFSPDGQKIVFATHHPGVSDWQLTIMNALDGSNKTRLTTSNASGTGGGVFSPDGNQLAFVRMHGFGTEIHLLTNVNDPNSEVQLTFFGGGAGNSHPAWSPDGRTIVFQRGQSISTIDVATKAITHLTLTGHDQTPTFSRDGTQIIFSSYPTGQSDIYIMDAVNPGNLPGGQNRRPIITTTTTEAYPKVRP